LAFVLIDPETGEFLANGGYVPEFLETLAAATARPAA